MDFYFVERDQVLELPIDGELVTYVFLRNDSQKITADRLYFAPSDEIQRVIERFQRAGYRDFTVKVFLNKRQIFEHPKFPLNLTYSGGYFDSEEKFIPLEEKIKPLSGKEKVRIAIVNGMGGGVGDNIVGMTALNIFYDRLMQYFKEVDIGIFTLRPRALPILKQETIVNEIYLMPAPTELLFQYDAFVDLSNMTGWPIFRQEMVDFYLQAMSIDPKTVPSEEKRCFVKLNPRVANELEPIIKALKGCGKPLLLYHPKSSSPIRSVPDKLIPKHLRRILEISNFQIVSLLPLNFKHKNFVNLYQFSRKSFDHFAYLISQMDAIITVDTAVYHVADSFSIPTVVLFTSIPPEHRLSYYTYQEGLLIGGKNGKPLFYRHSSDKNEEIEAIQKAFSRFKIEKALEILKNLIKKRQNLIKVSCPICQKSIHFIPSDRYRTYRHLHCDECDAEFVWPRKGYDYDLAYSQGKTDVAQYGHYIPNGNAEEIFGRYLAQHRFQKVKRFLEFLPEKKTLLDIGCANGFFVKYARQIGFRAFGLEASGKAVEWGEKHFGLKGFLAVGTSLAELPSKFPEKFQVITAFELLEHLEEPLIMVKEISRRLEPGGFFIFSTPNRNTLGRLLGLKDERIYFIEGERDQPPDHLTRFTLKTHRYLVEKAGLEVYGQWALSPLPGDLERVLKEVWRIPNLEINFKKGDKVTLKGDQLRPFFCQSLSNIHDLFEGKGLFLITLAVKRTN